MSARRLPLFAVLVCAAAVASAQTVPLRMVDGHLLASATLTNAQGNSNEVTFEIALERPEVLVLHEDQHEWLEQSPSVGVQLTGQLQFVVPASELRVERQPSRERTQHRLTAWRSAEMDERPVKGTLGAGFLRRYRVVMDVPARLMTLQPPTSGAQVTGQWIRNFEIEDGRVSLPVSVGSNTNGNMILGSGNYDTFIDTALAREMEGTGGEIGAIRIGRESQRPVLDISQDLALRSRPFAADEDEENDGATLVSGVNLLENFRVQIDWNASLVSFDRQRSPSYPQADAEFFRAEASVRPESIGAWLKGNPNHRLSVEGAALLMQWQIERHATDDELMQALQWVVDTAPAGRRMETAVEHVRAFAGMPGRAQLVKRAGELALTHARGAVSVQEIYRLHNLLGEALLREGELTPAWEHLLSAAFMPLDNAVDLQHNLSVNLNLARVYDKQGRAARAYSRYRKALALMNLKIRDRPSLIEIAQTANDASLSDEARQLLETIRSQQAEIDAALERLRPLIPADSAVLADG